MKRFFWLSTLAILVCLFIPGSSKGAVGGLGNDNPGGVTGDYNGSITTAGSYDPYTGNAKRIVVDLTVTGSLGKYPLKWTRVLNTRDLWGWSGGYSYSLWLRPPDICPPPTPPPGPPVECDGPDGAITYPDGRRLTLRWEENQGYVMEGGTEPVDRLEARANDNYDLVMLDGGRVRFEHPNPASPHWWDYRVTKIIDPYGLATDLQYDSAGRLSTITEPGGRYLQINSSSVQAFDGRGSLIETVTYIMAPLTFNNFTGMYLTRVQYDDGTAATYTYQPNNIYSATLGLIKTCHDPRYAGVMKDIEYEFMNYEGNHVPAMGEIRREKNATTTNHQMVSEVIYLPPSFPYVASGRDEIRPDGTTRHFQYSSAELVSYSDFEGHVSTIGYEWGTNTYYLKTLTDARTNVITTKKDIIAGAVLAVTRGTSPPVTVKYDYWDPNNPYYLKWKTDENDKRTIYTRYGPNDPNGPEHAIRRIDYPDAGFEEFTYNNFGQVLTHVMTSGGTENFLYYPDNRGLKWKYWPPATPSDENPGDHPTIYSYYGDEGGRPDRIDRLKSVTDPLGHITTYDYNKRGQVTRVTHHDLTYTQSAYNDYDAGHDDGTLAWTADENHPDAGMPGHENERTRYVYDEYQRVTSVTDPEEKVTSYNYTPVSNLSLGPLSHTSSSVYRVTSHTGKETEYDYDGNFRRTRMTVGLGTDEASATTYTYDEVGNQLTVTLPNNQPGEAVQVPYSISEYDELNRRKSLTDAFGQKTKWEYDPAGNMKKETRADTKFRTWDVYDAMNRIKQTTGFLGTQDQTHYDYDSAGNLMQMIDSKNASYSYLYDKMNRKVNAKYPIDAASTGGTHRSETWKYDAAGNLTLYRNPANQYKHFVPDERNRTVESYWNTTEDGVFPDQSVGDQTFTGFDPANRVTYIKTNGQSGLTQLDYGYDKANHKLWEDQTLNNNYAAGHRVETFPDGDGNRRTLKVEGVEGGYSLTYDYTPRQQLFHINRGVDPYFEFTYDKNGNLKKRQNVLQGGGSTNFSYDKGNRVTLCTQFSASANPHAFARTDYNDYDLLNRVKSISRVEGEGEEGKGDRFTYDDASQLSSASYRVDVIPHGPAQGGGVVNETETALVADVDRDSNRDAVAALEADPVREPLDGLNSVDLDDPGTGPRTVTYNNDPINRMSMSDNGAMTTYTPNGLNQYTDVSGQPALYDAKFNLSGYNGWTYVYDADNRLISATATGHIAQFVYDGLGRCVKRTIDGDATIFTYDGWKAIVEWTGAGGFVAWNIYGPGADEILARRQPNTGGYLLYHLDAMGNVQYLISGELNLGLEKYTYDAFGHPTIRAWNGDYRGKSQYGNRFMFTGREYLYTLGIYDYRHRLYHPRLGRFIQTDPIGFKGDPMNLYRYCGGNPINHSDPMGLDDDGYVHLSPAEDHLLQQARVAVKQSLTSRPTYVKELHRNVRFSTTQAVLRREHGNELKLSRLVQGGLERHDKPGGARGWTQTETFRVEAGWRAVIVTHGHLDLTGLGEPRWSGPDRTLARHATMVERFDESQPNTYKRLVPRTDGSGKYREEVVRNSTNSSSPTNNASGLTAALINSNHQPLDVASLGAETVNFAPGRE